MLAAELLEAELTILDWVRPNQLHRKIGALIPSRRGKSKTLVIAPHPEHLLGIVGLRQWLSGSAFTAALVTDSFLVERIPRMLGKAGHYDHLFVHDADLVDDWHRRSGLPVSWLPVGSDVLRHGSSQANRPVDVLRIGRQPEAWDNDEELIQAAAEIGLHAAGRPPMFNDAQVGYSRMMQTLGSAKCTLAFGSRVNPTNYTHPSREMLSYRWADSLAAGAMVAGMPPRNLSAQRLLWPDALIEVSPFDLDAGLEALRRQLEGWTPKTAESIYRTALVRFDWRWRLRNIAEIMQLEAPRLDAEVGELQALLGAPLGEQNSL